jgi:hypothetical protein
VANGLTVLFSAPAIVAWAINPSSVVALTDENAPPAMLGGEWYKPEVLLHQNNHWAIMVVIAVHTYHCMAFPLSKQDIFHHLMFVPTIGVYGGFGVEWGPVRNCVAFFISGLPGGIDYVRCSVFDTRCFADEEAPSLVPRPSLPPTCCGVKTNMRTFDRKPCISGVNPLNPPPPP